MNKFQLGRDFGAELNAREWALGVSSVFPGLAVVLENDGRGGGQLLSTFLAVEARKENRVGKDGNQGSSKLAIGRSTRGFCAGLLFR